MKHITQLHLPLFCLISFYFTFLHYANRHSLPQNTLNIIPKSNFTKLMRKIAFDRFWVSP